VPLRNGKPLRQKIPQMTQRRDKKCTRTREWFEDGEPVEVELAQVQPIDNILGHLSWGAMRPEALAGVLRDQSVLVHESQAVRGDVPESDRL